MTSRERDIEKEEIIKAASKLLIDLKRLEKDFKEFKKNTSADLSKRGLKFPY